MSLGFLSKSHYQQGVYVRLNSKHTSYHYRLISTQGKDRQLWTAVLGNRFCLVKSDVLFYPTTIDIIYMDGNNSRIFHLLLHFASDENSYMTCSFSLRKRKTVLLKNKYFSFWNYKLRV